MILTLTPFLTPVGVVGLLVFGPGCWSAFRPGSARSVQVALALACVAAIAAFALVIYGFADGAVASTSTFGTVFWISIVVAFGAGCVAALIRLLR